ncbi:Thioredoxin-like fold [Trinorchestia longiramus]|nr:Thioredoxin-like fold [Trinorchestia longiramus]
MFESGAVEWSWSTWWKAARTVEEQHGRWKSSTDSGRAARTVEEQHGRWKRAVEKIIGIIELGRLVSESACERKDPGSNPAADMVDAARNTAWDLVSTDQRRSCTIMSVSSNSSENIFDIEVIDVQGNAVKMSAYRGKVLLIQNTASL